MRPLLTGISLLALITGLAPAAAAEVIQNPNLVFGPVPWEFSTRTNTFSGEQFGGVSLNSDGLFALSAKFDNEGTFKTGTFQYRALDNHLLLQGKLSEPSVRAVPDGDINSHYFVRFGLIVHRDDLPFPVDGGEFNAFVCDSRSDCGGEHGGPTSLEGVFTTDYMDAAMQLNNFLITFHDDVSAASLLLASVAVPAPAPGVLLGVGMAILLAMRLRRLT